MITTGLFAIKMVIANHSVGESKRKAWLTPLRKISIANKVMAAKIAKIAYSPFFNLLKEPYEKRSHFFCFNSSVVGIFC